MERTEYNELHTSATTIEKEAIYISEDLGDNKTFDGIIDKYNSYRFEEHIDNIRGEFECQSYSHIIFSIQFIINENSRKFLLFTAILQIPNRNEIEYTTSTIYDETENQERIVNDL